MNVVEIDTRTQQARFIGTVDSPAETKLKGTPAGRRLESAASLLSLRELADIAGISLNRAMELHRKGQLPTPSQEFPAPRWTRSAVAAWLALNP